MDDNSLSPTRQAGIVGELIRRKPIRSAVLLLIGVLSVVAAMRHDPFLFRYSARLGDAEDRRLETIVIVNPNASKQELVAQLMPAGQPTELGFDYAYAIDLALPQRFANGSSACFAS